MPPVPTTPSSHTDVQPPPNAAPQRRGRILSLLAILAIFLGIGAAVILECPPLWRDYDGLIQITSHPNDMVLLQYPAAYPFFSRLHIYAAEKVQGWRQHHKTSIRVKRVVVLNDAGIHALMISQQIILALALTALVWQGAQSLGARGLMVAILASNASIFIMANLISTEALAVGLIIALAAISVRLFRDPKWSVAGMVAYTVCLYVAIMTRHLNSILAMLLPLAFILRFVAEWIRTRRADVGLLKRIGIFVLLGLICIGGDRVTTRLLCRVFHVEYRDISARATAERLGFVKAMPPAEEEAFLANLEKKTDDPVVKEAIPLLARPATWVQQREEILKILEKQSPGADEEALKVKADAYLDRVARLFFQTRSRYLIQDTLDSIWHGLGATTPTDVTMFYLKDGAWSIDLYASHPEYAKKTSGLEVCSPAAKDRITAFETNPWLRLWAWAPHGLILLIGSVLALIFLIAKIGEPAIPLFALAAAITAVTATCLTFVMTNYGARFTTVADICAFLTLSLTLGHWLDSRRRSTVKAAGL
ncbi:MAG TPA: hypothetical protein VGM54_20450 [Chthoniobacter sp.]|jgi:hypothetical protein